MWVENYASTPQLRFNRSNWSINLHALGSVVAEMVNQLKEVWQRNLKVRIPLALQT